MTFDFKTFVLAIKLYCSQYPITPRRILLLSAFLLSYIPMFIVNRVGFLLDFFLFPGVAAQPLENSVHILGNPRSGTTYLHSLLLLDEERFVSLTLYDIIFPAVSIRNGIEFFGRIDQKIGSPCEKVLRRLDTWMFRGVDHIHPTSLYRAEEDGHLFIHTFMTPVIYLLFPFREELPHLGMLDSLLKDTRQSHMQFYKKCLQSHLFKTARKKLILSKNVSLNGSIKSLIETFPDTKIIFLMRNPLESIPSTQSLILAFSRFTDPTVTKQSQEIKETVKVACKWYKTGYDTIKELPSEQVYLLKYEDLISKPELMIRFLYDWLGHPITSELAEKLTVISSKGKSFSSRHQYSSKEFGTDEEYIREELSEVFERFGW